MANETKEKKMTNFSKALNHILDCYDEAEADPVCGVSFQYGDPGMPIMLCPLAACGIGDSHDVGPSTLTKGAEKLMRVLGLEASSTGVGDFAGAFVAGYDSKGADQCFGVQDNEADEIGFALGLATYKMLFE